MARFSPPRALASASPGTGAAAARSAFMRARRFTRSSMIEHVAYDEAASVLCITFRDSGKYLYHDVPRAIYDGLCAAESPGAFFNAHIKENFRCERDPSRRRFGPGA
ncbi:KTSC domain-containing protein [Sphingopyxis sp.]|uniref:KTSC domain-containing protein n=1 Tax=Sphingopyxis sp. TaxID=1908224 RepID=UPI002E08F9E2|nr:KTSC domain-containing protein [Sphingopyxis sp.]